MTVFPQPLKLEDAGLCGDVRLFRLLAHFVYRSSLGTISVPAGFVTDGASIPRGLWSVFSPTGPWFGAAVIHDFLYSPHNTRRTRKEADLLFKEAMFNAGLDWPRREMIFRAVRLFGGANYRGLIP